LIELLSAMAILSILVLVLATMLDAAFDRFREGAETVEQRGDARVALGWIERDLSGHIASRPANLPRLPDNASTHQREWFEGRLFLPFEVSRLSGSGEVSFPNAATGFGTLAFATRLGTGGEEARDTPPAVVGYYVAYARHSPLAGDDGAGMKLFRHYRPGGHPTGEGYADGLLLHATHTINHDSDPTRTLVAPNEAVVRQGRFENAGFPFLFATREDPDAPDRPRAAVPPWPARPVIERLVSPPPTYQPSRGTAGDWADPTSPVHDSVFPDEAICDHVVRFELKPFRRVTLPSGGSTLMDASALNQHLGLSGGTEWPALVAPDLIEVIITVVDEVTARRLSRYGDWIIDWDRVESPAATSADRVLLATSRTTRQRVALPARTP
jgi:hypothetical protein